MARQKKRKEPQYTTQAVGEEALDRGVRGIDIKPIAPSSKPQSGRNDEHGRRTGRGGKADAGESDGAVGVATGGDGEGEDSGR